MLGILLAQDFEMIIIGVTKKKSKSTQRQIINLICFYLGNTYEIEFFIEHLFYFLDYLYSLVMVESIPLMAEMQQHF